MKKEVRITENISRIVEYTPAEKGFAPMVEGISLIYSEYDESGSGMSFDITNAISELSSIYGLINNDFDYNLDEFTLKQIKNEK